MITVKTGSISLSRASAAAGTIVFALVNPDTTAHEVDIVRTALPPTSLPTKASGQSNEGTTQAGVVKEAVKVGPRRSRTFTARLSMGSYVIVDNLPGHYRARETVALTIT